MPHGYSELLGAIGFRSMLGLKIAKAPDLYKLWEYKVCTLDLWVS